MLLVVFVIVVVMILLIPVWPIYDCISLVTKFVIPAKIVVSQSERLLSKIFTRAIVDAC